MGLGKPVEFFDADPGVGFCAFVAPPGVGAAPVAGLIWPAAVAHGLGDKVGAVATVFFVVPVLGVVVGPVPSGVFCGKVAAFFT